MQGRDLRSSRPPVRVRGRSRRRGATMVEAALLMMVFAVAVLGMCEVGLAVFRHHAAGEAARHGARLAIVHGELAQPEMTEWGPTEYVQAASTNDEICNALRMHLTGLDVNNTMVRMEWLDGSTAVGSRVRVTVSTPYQPMLTALLGSSAWQLSGTSTMHIAH